MAAWKPHDSTFRVLSGLNKNRKSGQASIHNTDKQGDTEANRQTQIGRQTIPPLELPSGTGTLTA